MLPHSLVFKRSLIKGSFSAFWNNIVSGVTLFLNVSEIYKVFVHVCVPFSLSLSLSLSLLFDINIIWKLYCFIVIKYFILKLSRSKIFNYVLPTISIFIILECSLFLKRHFLSHCLIHPKPNGDRCGPISAFWKKAISFQV